ncbi:MAG: tetratricopeptide repeat protein, partial [Desulfobacterota bacterium]|nr:tetratricopeptide repeat protein [Thermodesulfobacteriota bacterium]
WSPYEFFKKIYDQIEFRGVLITTNYQFGTSYLQQCEKYRPDVTLLFLSEILAPQFFHEVIQERYPLIKIPKYPLPQQKAKIGEVIINANINEHAFYWDPTTKTKFYKLIESNLLPAGFLFIITPSPTGLTPEIINIHNQKIGNYLKANLKEANRFSDEEENTWYASIFCNQSEFFTSKNEAQLGIYYHQQALRFMPKNYTIFNALGADYAGVGNYKQAEIYFKKALDLAPDEITILKNLGQLYLDQKNYLKAIYYYQQYIKKDSKNPRVYYNLAFCYAKLNKPKEVREALKKVIMIDPKNKLAKSAQEKLSQLDKIGIK